MNEHRFKAIQNSLERIINCSAYCLGLSDSEVYERNVKDNLERINKDIVFITELLDKSGQWDKFLEEHGVEDNG